MTNEEFYDAEVAPKLRALCAACNARGMSFLASVEYAPESTGETTQLAQGHTTKALMAYWGIKAHGNVDSLMMAAYRHALQHGHSSMVLSRLGVPTSPSPQEPERG